MSNNVIINQDMIKQEINGWISNKDTKIPSRVRSDPGSFVATKNAVSIPIS